MKKGEKKLKIFPTIRPRLGSRTRGYLQISFTWLFSIIAGAIILFLVIFMTSKLISTEQMTLNAKTGTEIGILLNPVEMGFESAKSTTMTLPVETRIIAKCEEDNQFGKQIINLSQKNLGEWTVTNIEAKFTNKYIFSKNLEGETFYIFVKPFELGFKVADLIYMTSSKKEYCFENAPENIKKEIEFLNQKNLVTENCQEDSIEICFSGSCEIKVNYNSKYVIKEGNRMYFSDDVLMYAAIFSDSEVYECQVKRLMQRTANLALLYKNKANFVSNRGCNSNLNLLGLKNAAEDLRNSAELKSVNSIAEDINDLNKFAECRLW